MACVSKIGSLYEMVTKNVIVSTTNTVFGINPRAWIALPCEGLILLKIRQVVPTAGSALPVQIAVPANSTVSTVGADTCCPVTGVNVVNPINVAVTGAAMVNGTERLLYFNKVRGVLRLMDCCVPTTTAQASEVKAGKWFQVHTLDTNTVPKYELGKVVAVSEPRYLPPQPGQYQAMQTRVVDLTVELTGETKTYTVPESQNVAKAMGITLSTSIDPIMNELNAIKNTSQDIINSVDAHRAKIEACESILEDINPAFKQTREQDRKIAGIENKVNDLTDSFEDLKKLIVERLK